ncbi:3-oxoadipate enol-lactonase [Massilia terrae]|uniref:3-oxoadipate enol-lactonase n=1 Tax=Massilia terrae TaxID=1811224 RepID=A0ABT2CTF0_9BURK|nr:3-oxoadipate enol-lactonase [Massilia terrae]MCS0657257.1 3-oxoadipate enol-lactonase [Massilia terrae]
MPFAEIGDHATRIRLHYRTDGSRSRPCVVLSNSLGTDLGMWHAQVDRLAADFFVVRYDTRGHGQSDSARGPASIEDLGRDVIALLDFLDIRKASFCGISMGGLTGQWLGAHAAYRIDRLVLADTAAKIGAAAGWNARAAQVRASGMDAVADNAPARWFTPGFIDREPGKVARMVATLRAQDAEGYASCCDALAHADLRESAGQITAPTLLVAGEFDPVTTVADAEWLRERIPGARMSLVPASHISNVEAEAAFTRAVLDFLLA